MHTNINPLKLIESRGLAARQRGELFKSTTDDSFIKFNSIEFYPSGGGQFSDEELQNEVARVQAELDDLSIGWINQPPNSGGFGVAIFDREDGGQLAFGRYFKQIKADPMANSWDNKTGVPGFVYASNASEKTSVGFTPQDILTNQISLTAQDIVGDIVNKFGNNSPLSHVAKHIAGGGSLPFTFDSGNQLNFTAFRDYFCELLHPIALQQGQYTGGAAKAAAKFLGGSGFSDTLISFGNTKTEGLSDSVMHTRSGKHIKVSSKGAKGATASVKNLVDAVDELEKQGNTELKTTHDSVIELIKEIQRSGQRNAPLVLGVKYGILSQSDVAIVNSLYNAPLTTMDKILAGSTLSATLKKLAKSRTTDKPTQLNAYYHLLAAIAHEAAAKVNASNDFSKAATDILNNGSLVQVYSKVTQQGSQWTLHAFDTVYPGTTVTAVLFKAGKTYYSTGVKGNFTFEILRNNAKDSDPDDNGSTTTGPQTDASPALLDKPRTAKIRPRTTVRKLRGGGSDTSVGREER